MNNSYSSCLYTFVQAIPSASVLCFSYTDGTLPVFPKSNLDATSF